MERWPPAVEASGDHYCRVVCGDRIDAATHERVQRAVAALQAADLEAVDNLHPAYATVGVSFDPRRVTAEAMRVAIAAAAREAAAFELPPARRIEVPVAYGAEWGPDLDAVARHVGITPEEVVARHARAGYIVHFLGFSPGFPYLGGLPPELATPRLPTPRPRVPAGSVAIPRFTAAWTSRWRTCSCECSRVIRRRASPEATQRCGSSPSLRRRPSRPMSWRLARARLRAGGGRAPRPCPRRCRLRGGPASRRVRSRRAFIRPPARPNR